MLRLTILIIGFGLCGYWAGRVYPWIERWFFNWQKKQAEKFTPRLDRMFLDVPIKRLILLDILCPLIGGGLAFVFVGNLLGIILGVGFGLLIPSLVIKYWEQARMVKFRKQLVDGLMVLSGALKAGLSLLQAFEVLVEEMPNPISQEFSLAVRENRVGVPLEKSLADLKKRMPVEELDLVITAILVAREVGGNLTETFSQLVFTIREKNKLMDRVRTLTVQGRLQGWIMSLLPVFFAIFVHMTNPRFFDILFQDRVGQFLIGYAIFSQIVGIFLIRKLSKVEV